MSLDRELAWFEQNRWMWSHSNGGQYALVKGETVFGFYHVWYDAVCEGLRRFGPTSFLVKKCTIEDEVFWI